MRDRDLRSITSKASIVLLYRALSLKWWRKKIIKETRGAIMFTNLRIASS